MYEYSHKWNTNEVVNSLRSVQVVFCCQMGYEETFGFQSFLDAGLVGEGLCTSDGHYFLCLLCARHSHVLCFVVLTAELGERYFIILSSFSFSLSLSFPCPLPPSSVSVSHSFFLFTDKETEV